MKNSIPVYRSNARAIAEANFQAGIDEMNRMIADLDAMIDQNNFILEGSKSDFLGQRSEIRKI